VEIPDVIIVGVDISMNNACDESSKCYNITELSESEVDRVRTATRKIKRKKVEKCTTSSQNSEIVSNVQIRHWDVWRIVRKFFFPLREHIFNEHGNICLDDYP